jgi:glycerol-3-phosphate acyltransferase PlsY
LPIKHSLFDGPDGGKRRGTLNAAFVDAIGYSIAVWLRFFASKTVTCGFGYLFFISLAAFSAASYVPNPDFSCRSTAT